MQTAKKRKTAMKQYLDSLKTIWLANFIANACVLVVVCLYIFSPIATTGYNLLFIRLAYAIQLIAVVLSLFASRRYRSKVQTLKNIENVNDRLSAYKKLYKQTLLFSSLLFLVSSLALFLSSSTESIIIPIALLFLLFLKRPYLIKLKMELALSNEDVK